MRQGQDDSRKVTFVFSPSEYRGAPGSSCGVQGHCSGINALLLSHTRNGIQEGNGHQDVAKVWTASRDSLIKMWECRYPEQKDGILGGVENRTRANVVMSGEFEGHIDWVNDLCVLKDSDGSDSILASCSSDGTIRLWENNENATSVGCLYGHKDYVTCLCTGSMDGSSCSLVSAGLLGEVFVWDVAKQEKIFGFRGIESSIYSSACDDTGQTVFAGGSDGGIYVLDMRTGRAEAHLKAHRHGVRALLMSGDAQSMVSGGSDHTAKIWDVGQRSVVHTLAMHTDSVWCLDGGPERDVGVLYSGGRDGCVYKTDTKSLSCELVVNLGKPITCLKTDVLNQDSARAIWVGSTMSSVQCYLEKSDLDDSRLDIPGDYIRKGECFTVGSVPLLRERKRFESTGLFHPRPTCGMHPDLEIQGVASIVEVKPLTDKRHLLTRDSDGSVALWDVSQATRVEELGSETSIKDAEREKFDPTQSALTWFQPDSSLGVVAGQLNPSSCFSCEAYVKHFGYPEAPPDEKINMAVEMLKELFNTWRLGYLRNKGDGKDETFDIEGITNEEQSDSIFHFAAEASPAVTVSGDAYSLPWKKRCSEMDGTEDIPVWAAKCVLDNRYPISKALKMSFILCPRKGSNLPPMQQSKLNAPRVLEVEKITDYVMKKLTNQGYDLVKEPVFWSMEKQAQWGSMEAIKDNGPFPDDGSNDSSTSDRRGFTNNLSSAINYGMKHFRHSSMDQSQNNALLLTCNGMFDNGCGNVQKI
eukprot:jgi/Picsp_1/4601/NSC_01971-R1_wd repeat-containing protein 48-like